MTEIILKPELLKGLQKVLVEYEPKNEDPILASQYLSAVVGSIVATAEIPKKDKDEDVIALDNQPEIFGAFHPVEASSKSKET